MKTNNINQYVQELERTIRLLNSDNNAIKQIKEIFYEENKKLKKELRDIKSKKAQLTKELRMYKSAYKVNKNKLKKVLKEKESIVNTNHNKFYEIDLKLYEEDEDGNINRDVKPQKEILLVSNEQVTEYGSFNIKTENDLKQSLSWIIFNTFPTKIFKIIETRCPNNKIILNSIIYK